MIITSLLISRTYLDTRVGNIFPHGISLCTKIPHNVLLDKVSWFVNKAFDCLTKFKDPKSFVCYSRNSDSAYYSKNKSKVNISLDATELIATIKYIVES